MCKKKKKKKKDLAMPHNAEQLGSGCIEGSEKHCQILIMALAIPYNCI